MRRGVTPERVLAVGGVAALFFVGIASALMVTGVWTGEDSETVATAPAVTATATPTATPKPKPKPKMTAAQRAARRAAVKVVEDSGFEVVTLRDYDARKTLRVLVGKDPQDARKAFFFVKDDYIGTDATEPSAKVRKAKQGERYVTLAYGVFAPGDQRCCPSGGPVTVRFAWDGAQLTPRDPLPPAQQRTAAYQTQ